MEDIDIKKQIVNAILNNDIPILKHLKNEVSRQKWVDASSKSGKGMMALLESNPFIKWKD